MAVEDDDSGFTELEFTVEEEDKHERLDSVLTKYLQQAADSEGGIGGLVPSRSKVEGWIEAGCVRLGSEVVTKPAYRVAPGSTIFLVIPPGRALSLEPDASVPLNIVFEDEHLLVLDKQGGLVVHPGAGQPSGTIVNGLLAYLGPQLKQVGDALRPGIVHRLDRGTSGLMVVAKSDTAYQALLAQFVPPRTIKRKYLALTARLPYRLGEGVIDEPIGRHPVHRQLMAVRERGGKEAKTNFRVLEQLNGAFLIELELCTGRTHQIRVHLKHAGAPIIGDPAYSPAASDIPAKARKAVNAFGRQALHAVQLSFLHPITKEEMTLISDAPEDMRRLIEVFRS